MISSTSWLVGENGRVGIEKAFAVPSFSSATIDASDTGKKEQNRKRVSQPPRTDSKSELFVVSHRRKMDAPRSFRPTETGGVAEGRHSLENENKAKAKQSPRADRWQKSQPYLIEG